MDPPEIWIRYENPWIIKINLNSWIITNWKDKNIHNKVWIGFGRYVKIIINIFLSTRCIGSTTRLLEIAMKYEPTNCSQLLHSIEWHAKAIFLEMDCFRITHEIDVNSHLLEFYKLINTVILSSSLIFTFYLSFFQP